MDLFCPITHHFYSFLIHWTKSYHLQDNHPHQHHLIHLHLLLLKSSVTSFSTFGNINHVVYWTLFLIIHRISNKLVALNCSIYSYRSIHIIIHLLLVIIFISDLYRQLKPRIIVTQNVTDQLLELITYDVLSMALIGG